MSMDGWTGIGEKKRGAIEATQRLYRQLLPHVFHRDNAASVDELRNNAVTKIVPKVFLYDAGKDDLTVAAFIDREFSKHYEGKKLDELVALQRLLRNVCLNHNPPTAYDAIKWQDLPLRLNSRIEAFLLSVNSFVSALRFKFFA